MAIGNLQVIDIGLQNESAGSDSLYLAFNKTKNNFAILANAASQYVTFTGNSGIGVNANPNTGTVDITNTGVISLTAGDGSITLSEPTPGNLVITANGGGNGGGVSSVGVSSSTLTVSNSPIISSGNIVLNLPTTGIVASQYTNPTLTVDTYGRITNIANNTVSGTVTSVSVTPGTGMQVTTSGNANINPGFTLINTGVTRVSAGSGIQVSSGNGNVTISTTPVAAVTSVSVASTSLTVTGSPITGSGTITVDLANTISISGNITGGNLITAGNAVVGGIKTNNYYYANGSPLDMQQPAGSNTQIQFNNANDFGASANLTFNTSTNTLSATTIAGTLATAAQPNITSTGTLASLSVAGNANIGNIGTSGLITTTGNVTGGNIVTAGAVSATGNITGGNLVLATGNIIYTPRYGSFYSNTTQTNPVANTAMAMTFNNTGSANGVSITSSSQLTVAKAGVYNIEFSAQCTKTDAGTDYVEIWLSKNGTSVPWTNTRLKLEGSNVYQVAAWNFVETLGAGEYVQVMWGSADLNAQLVAIPSANTTMGIDVPSVIVTVTPVGA
jgi:hypothetical protein